MLSDPEKRAAYDAVGQGRRQGEPFTPPPDWDAGFEFSGRGFGDGVDAGAFSDFFTELFGRTAGRRAGRARSRGFADDELKMRGEDHHAKILLDLEDAWRGATRQITLRVPQLQPDGRMRGGERTLEVRIPAGVKPGQMIPLAGQGGNGHGSAPAGDVFLKVRFRPHPRFRVDGSSPISELPIAPWEAARGAVVPVELPDDSTLKVRVPPDAQSGRTLRVPGKGLPGATPGDLELVVRVPLPSGRHPRARKLYEQMAAELTDFDARKVAAAEAERGPYEDRR